MSDKFIIIDGNSLMNRAFFALSASRMFTKEGIFTNALYGFFNMIWKLEMDYNPKYMAVAFDTKKPTFRHEQYKDYKAGRKETAMELAMQFPIAKEILELQGIKYFSLEGFEADDIIGTLANQGRSEELDVMIVSGDRDMLQLVDDTVHVIYTKRGVTEFGLYNRESFKEEYGFEPEIFVDYKALVGDKSDNIIGVPKVGDKTAKDLVSTFGNLEDIYENIDNISRKIIKENLEEYKLQAFTSRELATINCNVPMGEVVHQCSLGEIKINDFLEYYNKLEFKSFLQRIGKVKSGRYVKVAKVINDANKIQEELVEMDASADYNLKGFAEYDNCDNDESKIKEKIATLEGQFMALEVSFADEHSLDDVIKDIKDLTKKGESIGLKIEGRKGKVYPPIIDRILLEVGGRILVVNDGFKEFLEELKKVKPIFYGHGVQEAFFYMMNYGYGLEKDLYRVSWDTRIGHYLLYPTDKNHDLEEFIDNITNGEECNLGLDEISWFVMINKARLYEEEEIKKSSMMKLMKEVELPLIKVMAEMEYNGILVDVGVLKSFSLSMENKVEDLKNKIYEISGKEFNINSTSQLGDVLIELGLPLKKTGKGNYKTGASALEKLRNEHIIIDYILEYRKTNKLKTTYGMNWLSLIADDGRIHAQFNQDVTATGRISSSNPNMQNLPVRSEDGREVRTWFVPQKGYKFIGLDYSQIELRVLAHLTEDESLIATYLEDGDIHKATAAKIFDVREEDVTPLQRSMAKTVVFGVIYGMGAFGLSDRLEIPFGEADKYIKDFFAKLPSVSKFMAKQVDSVENYLHTICGRILNKEKSLESRENRNQQHIERAYMNYPVQGSAADIMKIAMIKVAQVIEGEDARLLLQIHDEVVLEVREEKVDIIGEKVMKVMEEAVFMKVPLKVEINQGNSLFELK